MRLLITWLINAAALFALPYIMQSVRVESFTSALFAPWCWAWSTR